MGRHSKAALAKANNVRKAQKSLSTHFEEVPDPACPVFEQNEMQDTPASELLHESFLLDEDVDSEDNDGEQTGA